MNPASAILDLIGVETAIQVTGKSLTRVYRWTYPKERGGTGGVIPHSEALKLLAHAREKGIAITEADFLCEPTVAPEPVRAGAA